MELTFAARMPFAAVVSSQIVSIEVATGARTEHTAGPGLKVMPQFIARDRIGYLVKAGPKEGLAYTGGGPIEAQAACARPRGRRTAVGGLPRERTSRRVLKTSALQLGSRPRIPVHGCVSEFLAKDGKLVVTDSSRSSPILRRRFPSWPPTDRTGVEYSAIQGCGALAGLVAGRAMAGVRVRRVPATRVTATRGKSSGFALMAHAPRTSPRVCPTPDSRAGRPMGSGSCTGCGEGSSAGSAHSESRGPFGEGAHDGVRQRSVLVAQR